MLDAAVLIAAIAVLGVLFHPAVWRRRGWRATVTPLASIIGSGFLVIGPILNDSYGRAAALVMAALCVLALLFGAAIRANIARIAAAPGQRGSAELRLERLSSWILTIAYVISVAYYLNLFGAFAVSLADDGGTRQQARLVTTAVFVMIALIGWTRGFGALEGLEKLSVTLKLAIIAGLLTGLALHVARQASMGALVLGAPRLQGWEAASIAFGLIVTVQGFETSRYLGDEYDPATRIASMRRAQLIAAAIYVPYTAMVSVAFPAADIALSETAIIDIMRVVAPILPVLLVAAALLSQFSAAVADTVGAGGLLAEESRGRVAPRSGYVVLVAVGIALTWSANVFEIITIASRAFALYYASQAAIAALGCARARRRLPAGGFALLAGLGALMFATGMPVAV
ncbi:MAG: hypothetical protein Kow0058_12520 [Roseovarius sp.]